MERRFVVDNLWTLLIGLNDFLPAIESLDTHVLYDKRGLCDKIKLTLKDGSKFIITIEEYEEKEK